MYHVAKAENSSLKIFSTSLLVEVKLHIQALMPKGAGLGFFLTNAGVSLSRVELSN